jgi:pimeloyl-ACP methyl ester carboxylesterase
MSIIRRMLPSQTVNRRHHAWPWIPVLVAMVVPWLASQSGHAQEVSNTGSIAGLEARFIDVPAFGTSIRTRYYDQGQGDPMVLVHGGGLAASNGNSANMWAKNIPGLAQRFRVFAVDKLAAGMTDNPPDGYYNLQSEVEHMYQFIQTMNLGQVHLVGQSRGAGLAWLLAMTHPEVVRTLVLVDSGTASPVVGVPKHNLLMEQCPQELAERMKCEMRILSYQPNYPSTWDDEYYEAALHMANLPKSQDARARQAAGAGGPLPSEWETWKKRLHERLMAEPVLPMPLLLYWGWDDPQAPAAKEGMAFLDVLAAQHPQVRMIISNQAGHFHFREYPDEFNHNVISFIDYWTHEPAASTASSAGSQTGSKTGAIDGLEPKFIDVKALGGTIRTRYYEGGQGEPIVLIHGGGLASYNGNSGNVWSKNIPGLSKRFRVFAVDKLAAGMTDNPSKDDDLNIAGEVEHIYQFIQTMNLGPVHLVGQSRGAGLAWVLATKHPEVVKTLILVDSQTAAPELGNGVRASMMQPCSEGEYLWRMKCEMQVLSFGPKVASTWDEAYYEAGLYMGGLPKAAAARAKLAGGAGGPGLNGFVDGLDFEVYKERLHERLRKEAVFPMPTLMYWAYNDPQATRERALAFFDNLAVHHSKLRMFWVNKAGHFHFREYPDEFNHNLMSFIDYWNRSPA